MSKSKSHILIATILLAAPALVAAQAVGSVEYLLNYARTYLAEGKNASAASYAKEALAVEPRNAEALAILRATAERSAVSPIVPAKTISAGEQSAPGQLGSSAYLLNYAKQHLRSGSYAGAANYAQQALKVDPGSSEAKQILALARSRAGASRAGNSCQAQFATCWAGAQTYSPGTGYKADNPRRQQCFVLRNSCEARAR
jgi:tetratricopeptide (TPR) repeat protein